MATTYSLLAATAGQKISSRAGTVYTADSFGLITGVAQNDLHDMISCGCQLLSAGTVTDGAAWNDNVFPQQTLAAAGSTQGAAGLINSNRVKVTVTASTEGVILKAVATGAETSVVVPGTVGAKVYPPSNCKIDALSTNTAVALVAGKGSIFIQTDATHFVTKVKGA